MYNSSTDGGETSMQQMDEMSRELNVKGAKRSVTGPLSVE